MWHRLLKERKKMIQPFILCSYPKVSCNFCLCLRFPVWLLGAQLPVSKMGPMTLSENKCSNIHTKISEMVRHNDNLYNWIMILYSHFHVGSGQRYSLPYRWQQRPELWSSSSHLAHLSYFCFIIQIRPLYLFYHAIVQGIIEFEEWSL